MGDKNLINVSFYFSLKMPYVNLNDSDREKLGLFVLFCVFQMKTLYLSTWIAASANLILSLCIESIEIAEIG